MAKRILVVEDYEDSREILRLMLEMLGYSVDEAVDGWQAFEYVKTNHPDLILMDISMPGVDGLAATQLIRNLEGTADIPIIIITAHSQRYRERAIAAGCNDVVSKPIDFETVKSIINRNLSN
jgi:two-component system, cell cycle response regulator DivK